jgi:chorismate dehydratase
MSEQSAGGERARVRIGAVTYLNARPLTISLPRLAPWAEIAFDLPSRLADALDSGRLDVAMIPSIEYCRHQRYTVISDACIACDGPVRSVKLYGRVPVERIRTLALDEGSRTSAVLVRILLKQRFGLEPEVAPLPIGDSLEETGADAAMLIGDRGMTAPRGSFEFIWDLGEEWSRWTGLPFVFAAWIARPGIDLRGVDSALAAARDDGVTRLAEIARLDAPGLRVPEAECLSYLRDHLTFHLGDRQRQGLELFYALAARQRLAPEGVKVVFYDSACAR